MSILIIAPGREMNRWKAAMLTIDPSLEIEVFPKIKDKNKITTALVWRYPQGLLKEFPNLKWISSLGAGVDHILCDPGLPEHIRITRIMDDNLANDITKMVISVLTLFEKDLFRYFENQKMEKWEPDYSYTELKIGVLGVGHIGENILDALAGLNYEVYGCSKSGKGYGNYTIYDIAKLDAFLSQVNTVICTLPLTAKTENLINFDFFSAMNRGSYFINVSRGKIVDDNALLNALNEGILNRAYLDVFREEPLPAGHPFWHHQKIFITPHISGITNIENGAKQYIENYFSYLKEDKLNHEIDKSKGY